MRFGNKFFLSLQDQLTEDLDTIPLVSDDQWGLKVVFFEANTNERIAALAPVSFVSRDKARDMARLLSISEETGDVLGDWLTEGDMVLPEGKTWMPLYVKVVKYSVVPF